LRATLNTQELYLAFANFDNETLKAVLEQKCKFSLELTNSHPFEPNIQDLAGLTITVLQKSFGCENFKYCALLIMW
jgi:hypothetical protein